MDSSGNCLYCGAQFTPEPRAVLRHHWRTLYPSYNSIAEPSAPITVHVVAATTRTITGEKHESIGPRPSKLRLPRFLPATAGAAIYVVAIPLFWPTEQRSSGRTKLDHFIPLTANGTHAPDNLRCACRRCNTEKGNSTIWEKVYTFIAPPPAETDLTPKPKLTGDENSPPLWRYYYFDGDKREQERCQETASSTRCRYSCCEPAEDG